MKKIVSNVLIVSTQLIVGGLFLFMLFSDNNEDNRVVVIENNNLDKMADAVSELFVVDHVVNETTSQEEVELVNADEVESVEPIQEEVQQVQEEVVENTPIVETPVPPVQQEPVVETPPVQNTVTVDATGYISNPAVGFNVTTGNRTYSLSDDQFNILAAVVNCEANRSSKDDILGVMSVILNRADSSRYPNDPVGVVAQPYQFSCYTGQGMVVSETVASVIRDALNGVRNNSFYSFNAWYTNRSQNYIVTGGNRYF